MPAHFLNFALDEEWYIRTNDVKEKTKNSNTAVFQVGVEVLEGNSLLNHVIKNRELHEKVAKNKDVIEYILKQPKDIMAFIEQKNAKEKPSPKPEPKSEPKSGA